MRFWLLLLMVSARIAHAQAQLIPSDAEKGAQEKDVSGWNTFLSLTSTLNLTSNSNVIGQVDGLSTVFGLGLLGGGDYVKDEHVFRSTIAINESFARTPVIDRFIKANDAIKLEGIYNYFVTKTVGAYGRLSLATSAFRSYDIRGAPTSWVDATDDMMRIPLATNALSQKLAPAYQPLTISESAGGFYDPINKEEIHATLRLGLGGRHTFADGVYVNHDDKMTPDIELLRLTDVHQLGAEAFAGAEGKLDHGRANYKAGLAALWPFVNNDKYDRSATSLTRVALEGNLTYAMSSLLSLVYTVAITRDPQLFPAGKEEVQIQNTLLVTFQLNLVKKREKEVKTKEQLELEDCKKRVDEAEQRATAAEQKLQELQQPKPAAPAKQP